MVDKKEDEPEETAEAAATAPELPEKLRKQIAVSDGDDDDQTKPEVKTKAKPKPKPKSKPKKKTKPKAKPKPKPEPETEPEPEPDAEPEEPDEPAPIDNDIMEQSLDLDDTDIDEAVKDIVAHEGDVMLAVADATIAERTQEVNETYGQKAKGSSFSKIFWSFIFILAAICIVLTWLLSTGANIPGLSSF